MLSMLFVLPGAFALAIWNSYRVARKKEREARAQAADPS